MAFFDPSLPPRSRPELGNLQKTASTTTPRYSSMRPPTQSTPHIPASHPTTSSGTPSHRRASRCSCAILSRTRSTTPTMVISRSRRPSLRPRGTPSTSAPCVTRWSFRTRSQGGIRPMVQTRKGQADKFGIRRRSCSRCVLRLTVRPAKPSFLRIAVLWAGHRTMPGVRVPPEILPL